MPVQLITDATNNVTGIYTMVQYVQEISNSWFMVMILFAIFIILFAITKSASFSNSKPFATSAFFTMILAILFRTMGFISNGYLYMSISIMGIAIVWLYLENNPTIT